LASLLLRASATGIASTAKGIAVPVVVVVGLVVTRAVVFVAVWVAVVVV
jgi:hypothetical protein